VLGKPFTERLDENTSIVISKNTNRFDVEIQDREEGEIRIIALRESDNAWVEVPQDENVVPQFLRAEGTYAGYNKWYVEGLHPGRITLEFRYSDGVAEHVIEQQCLVATHKTRGEWRTEVRQQILLQTKNKIDMRTFNPLRPFLQNTGHIQAVYGYYEQLFFKHPTEFLWAGMAKMAGAPVYAALSDAEFGRTLPAIGPVAEWLGGIQAFQSDLMWANRNIFYDLAWQHRAYEASGIYALAYADQQDQSPSGVLPAVGIGDWVDLDQGIRFNNLAKIQAANRGLLRREQEFIVQPVYNSIQANEAPLGSFYDDIMSVLAENPIPTGPDFSVAVPSGNLAALNDRWKWIDTDTRSMTAIWFSFNTGFQLFEVSIPLRIRAVPYALFPSYIP
jgi:hypothetical protein